MEKSKLKSRLKNRLPIIAAKENNPHVVPKMSSPYMDARMAGNKVKTAEFNTELKTTITSKCMLATGTNDK